MESWCPKADWSLNLALKYWECLKDLEFKCVSVLVRQYCIEILLTPGVDHDRARLVAMEKWSQRTFILNEMKRFIHIGVTLLHGPLVHLLNKFQIVGRI
jgi:hypothetical protein